MKPLFDCDIEYSTLPHLTQIYDGFARLEKKGIVKLRSKRVLLRDKKPIIRVIVNKKYHILYDVLDGFNWLDGTYEENIEHFQSTYKADFYFKRSYHKSLDSKFKSGKIYPLGLNFPYDHEGNYPLTVSERLKNFYRAYVKKNIFRRATFEYPPFVNPSNKILFLCGLWNPDSVDAEHLKTEREQINKDRIECVKLCRAEFGSRFTGGIQIDSFSRSVAEDLLVPQFITNKKSYLETVKTHNICVATKGLHDSIGWKFAEYVAASRSIISQPLAYEVTGNFEAPTNYLTFNSPSELIENINHLLKNKDEMFEMMQANHRFYNNFVDSEQLVLNTLMQLPMVID